MKKLSILLSALFALAGGIYAFHQPAEKTTNTAGVAVVELFTSEGCSSCPPADEAVAELAKEYPSNVYVLCFHVDYWNYLGWKDEFSSANYTERQRQYAAVFNVNSIYTPQAVVNGHTEFTGSDKKKLYSTVREALTKNDNFPIAISAKTTGSNEITVGYKTTIDNTRVLQIAIIQASASSVVKRGENKGKILHHINVVRAIKQVSSGEGTTKLLLPGGVSAKECRVIAFVQDKKDLHIGAAQSCAIQ